METLSHVAGSLRTLTSVGDIACTRSRHTVFGAESCMAIYVSMYA